MLSISFLLFVGLLVALRVKWGKLSGGDVFLCIVCGLALAATAVGPPILQGVTGLTEALFNGISGAVQA